MHCNLHNPYTTKNYEHQIQPTLHTPSQNEFLSWCEGDFFRSQYCTEISSKDNPPKKKSLQKHNILVFFKVIGQFLQISMLQLTPKKQNQKKKERKKEKKSPTKRSSRNPSIRVVVYNH
jgi:hypothetical protein